MVKNNLSSKFILASAVILFSVISLNFVFSAFSTSPSAFYVNESLGRYYNITVTNDDPGQWANITRVNITFPSNFTIIIDSNGTNSSIASFFNTTQDLVWINVSTGGFIINGSSLAYFWINATATPGIYNITVTVQNKSGNFSSYIPVTINDTTIPLVANSTNSLANSSSPIQRTAIHFNVSITEANPTNITFRLYNTTGEVNTTTFTLSAPLADGNYSINWTGLPSGNYSYNASVKNLGNLKNSTNTRIAILDTTAPAVSFVTPANRNNYSGNLTINVSVTDVLSAVSPNVYFNITNTSSGVQTDFFNATLLTAAGYYNQTLLFNATRYPDGDYNITVYSNDSLNNTNRSVSYRITIDNNAPVITLVSPTPSAASDVSANFMFNVTDVTVSNCSLIWDNAVFVTATAINLTTTNTINASSLSAGGHSWKISCRDAVNAIANSTSYDIGITPVTSTTTASGGGGSASSFWTATYSPLDAQFATGYTQALGEASRIKVKISSEDHYVGVVDIAATSVTINVSSTPQQAVFNAGEEKKFDVDSDSYYDLSVKLNGIVNNRADITIKTIHLAVPSTTAPSETPSTTTPETPSTPVSTDTETIEQESSSLSTWIIVILLVIVVLAVTAYLIYKKYY
ncbi:hypothetical protein HYW76_03570 [Candidatus Pacearchaeota archaeon]|nr:hypothetical protein [Candidatus Pacearchaeota archaeon]